mmetsp:Transcript_4531/g.10284  ORF Transcript_4531/g.10284 Transcript_4531/m.10284 type:complete len:148 (-) Transcript_4531:194-637(-)
MVRICLFALVALVGAAKKAETDCTVKSVWPDGTELERECFIEGEGGSKKRGGVAKGVSKDFKWMKDTRWHWNNWRDVIFRADGSFLAPAEGCEREGNPQCQWSSDDEKVFVKFGNAGLHTLEPSSDQQTLAGSRDRDGDPCSATLVQ